MIFDFLKKQKKTKEKIKLLQIAFLNMQIPEEQKALYIQSLDILNDEGIDRMYDIVSRFIENQELKDLEDIQKNNFSIITGLKKKEAEEKKKDINSFNFLLNNL